MPYNLVSSQSQQSRGGASMTRRMWWSWPPLIGLVVVVLVSWILSPSTSEELSMPSQETSSSRLPAVPSSSSVWLEMSPVGVVQLYSPFPEDWQRALALWNLSSSAANFDDDTPSSSSAEESPPPPEEENTCLLYLAPSSFKGDGVGYGVFTSRPLKKGDTILAFDGPSIAYLDYENFPGRQFDLLDNYWWGVSGGMSDHMMYEADQIFDYQVMFGALPNHHPILSNLENQQEAIVYDDSLVDRHVDPGAGAFSYYTGKRFLARGEIPAGHEIFLNYGDKFLDHHGDHGRAFDHIPRGRDYWTVARLIRQLPVDLLTNIPRTTATSSSIWSSMMMMMMFWSKKPSRQLVEAAEHFLSVIYRTAQTMDPDDERKTSRVLSLLPKTWTDLQGILRRIPSSSLNNLHQITRAVAYERSLRPAEERSVEYLQTHGWCLDHFVPGVSRIPQAGKGAMAQRHLPAGEVIGPVPLLHVPDRRLLATYPILVVPKNETSPHMDKQGDDPLDEYQRVRLQQPIGQQLLLNYCFGHDESTLILCPMTNAILINHASDRTYAGSDPSRRPNAFFRWATSWHESTRDYLTRPLSDLHEETLRHVLAMEIVALRDIAPGEEILMDYGPSWEQAWTQHVATWTPPGGAPRPTNVAWNAQRQLSVNGRLRDERFPVQHDMFSACWYVEDDPDERDEKETEDWWAMTDQDILSTFGKDGSRQVPEYVGNQGEYWPCSIVEVHENKESDGSQGEAHYTVRIFQSDMHSTASWEERDIPCFLTRYPRRSIRFFNLPYSSDQHLAGVFRHHIEIPDSMFPKQWKNKMT